MLAICFLFFLKMQTLSTRSTVKSIFAGSAYRADGSIFTASAVISW